MIKHAASFKAEEEIISAFVEWVLYQKPLIVNWLQCRWLVYLPCLTIICRWG